jgi:hypothetical protein
MARDGTQTNENKSAAQWLPKPRSREPLTKNEINALPISSDGEDDGHVNRASDGETDQVTADADIENVSSMQQIERNKDPKGKKKLVINS